MEDVARVTTLRAASAKSFQDAVDRAVARATTTLRNVTGVEVKDWKAKIEDGRVSEYRVTVDVSFILDN